MKGHLLLLLAALVSLEPSGCGGSTSGSLAESPQHAVPTPKPEIEMVPAQPAPTKDFPGACSFIASDGALCTCVLVGDQAVLTAGHCVKKDPGKNTGTAMVRFFDPLSSNNPATCLPDARFDLAACTVSRVSGRQLATLAAAPDAVGEKVLLTGFGCQGGSLPTGRLGEATATVTSPPDGNNLISLSGVASLCAGDSGGPAFDRQGLVTGINAKTVNLISVSTPSAQGFIQGWATANHVSVCGITGASPPCGVSSQRPAP